MDFLDWARSRKLPSALQSREGWAQLFEHYRSEEPHVHQIEPTNACPYSCIMCPRESSMSRGRGLMEMEVFTKIIDEVATYSPAIREKEIELFHFGESLLHPRLTEMVGMASSAGLRPVLSINPVDLAPETAIRLLQNRPYRIIVSLDSMKADRFRQIRGRHAKLDIAIRNTEALLEAHARQGSKVPIVVRMIVMHMNRDETEDFRQFWEERGAQVELREFFPWSRKELEELGKVEKYPPYMPCPFPWQYLVVQWNGDVVACCRDYNGTLKLGNVREQSLKDIWNGTAYRRFRESMASGQGLCEFCTECLDIYYQEPASNSS
ncbi:radical SAM/SPASM domain-containing protein [Thiolapillus sp.]